MSEKDNLSNSGWTVHRRHMPVLAGVLAFSLMCTGITGIYFGSVLQATKNDAEVDALKRSKEEQKLAYEQRLGKQSAQYAIDANNFGQAVASFTNALSRMDAKNDVRAAARERAQAEALLAAQRAAQAASNSASKTDQILVKQEELQQQVTTSVALARATEKTIDTAVSAPAATAPHRPWFGAGH